MDDVPDDIKDLIDMGLYSEEEALARCSAGGSRERRMVLQKPYIKLVGEDKTPVVQIFDDKYTEDDLVINLGSDDEDAPFDADAVDNDDEMSWLDAL